ncbi:hypothetical protein F0562_028948 [Nyssa sinensis]|uniref:Polymerase/histidinol phosphatase N-terminal domain-containing protein n=1 Tax=Nyssa sinensis TaxID=561372 RepID=A0A5J5B1P9_9ASTE|nr:hypothetical protein F0562_028948 [Nyssa sinensis]
MMGDGFFIQSTNNGDKENPKKTNGKKKKKKRGGSKKKMTIEETKAYKSVSEWVFLGSDASSVAVDNDFGVLMTRSKFSEKLMFELHSHSKCSDGFLTPSKLVERAHQIGVRVLALTDHDTMSGIPEALEAACRFGIKIIPGVEISTIFFPRGEPGSEEPVHILAYYSSCGPTRFEKLEKFLANIRLLGNGVAPGRLHVSRALVEAGHVENLKQAFARYLYDGGPAYSTGCEPVAEEVVQLICETGEVTENWQASIILKSERKLDFEVIARIMTCRLTDRAYSELADDYNLVKLGGSDYHGRGGQDESALGSVSLPVLAVHEFLKVARPIWCRAIRDILENYSDDPSELNLDRIMRFGKTRILKGSSPFSYCNDLIDLCLSSWLTSEERQNAEFEAIKLKLSRISINQGEIQAQVNSII